MRLCLSEKSFFFIMYILLLGNFSMQVVIKMFPNFKEMIEPCFILNIFKNILNYLTNSHTVCLEDIVRIESVDEFLFISVILHLHV